MQLGISVAARDRGFGRRMRRVRARFESLISDFAALDLSNDLYAGILIGVTDDKQQGVLDDVRNDEGYLQVLVGFNGAEEDEEQLACRLLDAVRSTVERGGFVGADLKTLHELIASWKRRHMT